MPFSERLIRNQFVDQFYRTPIFVNGEFQKKLGRIKGNFFRDLIMKSLKITGNLIIPRKKFSRH
jgi:hypothetical protein